MTGPALTRYPGRIDAGMICVDVTAVNPKT
jgi:hypothetical protein